MLIVNSIQKDTIRENIFDQLELIEDDGQLAIYRCNTNPIDYCLGITGDISVDYPTTFGMTLMNAVIDKNSAISDGTEGFVMFGPYTDTPDGIYDFILEYSLIEGDDAYFDILTDSSEEKGIVYLDSAENKALIDNVSLNSGHKLEYRVFCGEGTKIKIDKITIIKDEAN